MSPGAKRFTPRSLIPVAAPRGAFSAWRSSEPLEHTLENGPVPLCGFQDPGVGLIEPALDADIGFFQGQKAFGTGGKGAYSCIASFSVDGN